MAFQVPYQSPQIFSEFMDSKRLDSLIEPIPGSNMTTAILKGNTIRNRNFGVRAGQSVEILLISINEPITTFVVTPDLVKIYTGQLADMAKNIAENKELANRIRAFVGIASGGNDNDEVQGYVPSGEETLSSSAGYYYSKKWLLSLLIFGDRKSTV